MLLALAEKHAKKAITALHPLKDMKINDMEFVDAFTRSQQVKAQMVEVLSGSRCPNNNLCFQQVDDACRVQP